MKEGCGYTDGEIVTLYRQAKHKAKQIQILRELTLKSEQNIIRILTDGGVYKQMKIDPEAAMKLYNEGKNDSEIANVFGVSSESVFGWRKRNNLPTKFQPDNRKVPSAAEKTHNSEQKSDIPFCTVQDTKDNGTVELIKPVNVKVPLQCDCCHGELATSGTLLMYIVIRISGRDYRVCSHCAATIRWAHAKFQEARS